MNPDELINGKIGQDDCTPSILTQAKINGWKSEYYDFGKADGREFTWFNPSIVERSDGLWLLARGSEPHPHGFEFGQNDVWAFMLDETGTIPKMGRRLKWENKEPSQHFEDARGFYHPEVKQVMVGACSFCWYPNQRWTGAHQVFGAFDMDWKCRMMQYPKIGGNPGQMKTIEKHSDYEKNWLWWLHENQLHLLYKANPWSIYKFGNTWSDITEYRRDGGAVWTYGDIRGGTPPVKVGDYYFTFHHSSLPWKDRYRRYYSGCIAFDAKPPFTPRLITNKPMFTGSQNDIWAQRKPLVIFPCGAYFKDNEWLLTCGVNDLKAAWIKIPHKDVMKLLQPIDINTRVIFMESGLSPNEKKVLESAKHKQDEAIYAPPATKELAAIHGLIKVTRRSNRKKRRKFSPQALANLRANALKAREARKKKQLQEA